MSSDPRVRAFSDWLAKVDAYANEIKDETVENISGNGGLDTREHELFSYAGDLLKEGGGILAASIPQKVMCIALDDVEEPVTVEDRLLLAGFRLSLVMPIIDQPSFHDAMKSFYYDLFSHRYGGETELFGQSPIKGHGNRDPWRIASLRMEALAYYEVGRGRKVDASELQMKLHEAFGAPYDTIRKWRASAVKVHGSIMYEHSFKRKLDYWSRAFEVSRADGTLKAYGEEYRELWRNSRK